MASLSVSIQGAKTPRRTNTSPRAILQPHLLPPQVQASKDGKIKGSTTREAPQEGVFVRAKGKSLQEY
eukprot:2897457-Amphidinium_carterae.1